MKVGTKIFKILILAMVYIGISIGAYFVLKACGLGTVNQIREFIFKTGIWGYVVFFVFQVVVSTFICIIPFEDELLTASAIVLFGPLKGFFVASFNMFATSCLQFIIGRYFCKSLIIKLLGEDSLNKYQNYLKVKGEIMLPLLYAIPLFPHDSLCILSGMSKIKFWYFATITLIMRSVEIASICFLGSGLIDVSAFRPIDWIAIINLIIIDIYLIHKLQKYVENKINKK